MNYHVIMTLAACLFAGALSAQATISIGGTVNDNEQDLYLYDVDFGTPGQSITLTLTIAATGGSSGLDATLVDMDELAQNGSATGTASDFNAGTGTITVNMTTPTYSGVHQFAVMLVTDSSNGPSPYSGDLSTTSLNTGDITLAGFTTLPDTPGYEDLLGRGARYVIQNSATGTFTRDLQVDFGTVAQAITFFFQGFSLGGDGTMEVHEVLGGGTENLLQTVTLNSTTGWGEEYNPTTSSRSGSVTLRIKIIATDTNFYFWQLVVPGTVTSIAPSSSKKGGGDDGGCSTGESQDLAWLGLLAVLGAVGVASRLRS